jgi:hypothetical protein
VFFVVVQDFSLQTLLCDRSTQLTGWISRSSCISGSWYMEQLYNVSCHLSILFRLIKLLFKKINKNVYKLIMLCVYVRASPV